MMNLNRESSFDFDKLTRMKKQITMKKNIRVAQK